MEKPIAFFTATINSWKHLLTANKYKDIIVESLRFLCRDNRIWIYGFVIMPNHIHLLWRMQDKVLQKDVQRDFLKFTAQKIKQELQLNNPQMLQQFKSTQKDRIYQFWERRPYFSIMYNEKVVEQKLEYMHNNPVVEKWNLADAPENYNYSSARFYLLNIDDWNFITHYSNHI